MIEKRVIEFSLNINKEIEKQNKFVNEIKQHQQKHISKFKEIKSLYEDKLNTLIEELTVLEGSNISNYIEEDDISPAAALPVNKIPCFPDGTYNYTKTEGEGIHTFTLPEMLQPQFEITIKMIQVSIGFFVCGVSDKQITDGTLYLGGDAGPGTWGLATSGFLGENGEWKYGKNYKNGDTLTLRGNYGVISYAINGVFEEYEYDMKNSNLYLGFSICHKNNSIEILV